MKIILKKDVQGLGYKDEVLTVKDGYGRNYLLPQRLAVLATDKAIKALNEELKQRAHKLAKIKADAEEAAKQYEGIHLTIEAKVKRLLSSTKVFTLQLKLRFQTDRLSMVLLVLLRLLKHLLRLVLSSIQRRCSLRA